MNRLFLLLCCLPLLVADEIIDEDDADFDMSIFFCGIVDDYNVFNSRLVRVRPELNIAIDGAKIVNIRRSVFKNCGETLSLTMINTELKFVTRQRLEGLRNLRLLSLFNNVIDNVTDGTFDGLPHLTELELSYNRLTGLGAGVRDGLKELQKLHLNQNPIVLREDGFAGLSKLELLELTGANISTLPNGSFNGLGNLQRLDLSSNKLITISEPSFRSLNRLEELDLSMNEISEISERAFEGLANLKALWLNDNQISVLKTDLFDGISDLDYLYLHKNPLQFWNAAIFKNMRNVNIEPGFVTDATQVVRKNFGNASSTLYHCSRLYSRPELRSYDEASSMEAIISATTENYSLNYFKPYYCILVVHLSQPNVQQF